MGSDKIERSGSGDPIYRHKGRDGDFTSPDSPASNLEAITKHLEKWFGPVESVFHEMMSDIVHLDILMIPTSDDLPFSIVCTSGVSDLPMTVPEGLEERARAELFMPLRPDWPLSQEDFKDEKFYWPIRWLKTIGRLPHEYETWIGQGHTIPVGDPPEPLPATGFTGFMLMYADWVRDEVDSIEVDEGHPICLYELVPLYPEEMQLKLDEGAAELAERFLDRDPGTLLSDPTRPNFG